MDKHEENDRQRSGSTEWLEEALYLRWQVVRRDPEYVEFCNEQGSAFDADGIMNPWERSEPRAEEIKKLFGLETICHPSLNFTKEKLLDEPIFNNPLAVSYKWNQEHPGHSTPIFNDHFIRLRIDIGEERKMSQILSEVQQFVEEARGVAGIETDKSRLRPDEEVFKVWDLKASGKKPQEIMEELWPEEYKQEFKHRTDDDKRYKKLCTKYKRQGIAEWHEKAFKEAYGSSGSSGSIRLYMRVKDKENRMKEWQRRVRNS